MSARAKLGFIGAVTLATLAGCEQRPPAAVGDGQAVPEPSSAAPEDRDEAPATPPGEVDPPVASAPGVAKPGPVYFVVDSQSIVRLDHRGTKLLRSAPAREILDLFIGPDGGVYVLDAGSLRKIEGEALVEVEGASFDGVAPVRHAALATDGTPWVVGSEGVGARVGGQWEMTPLAELGLEVDAHAEVAIDSEGVVWVVGSKAAFYREQDEWLPLDLSIIGAEPLLLNPIPSPLGRVHTTNGNKLSRLHKTQLENVLIETKGLLSYTTDLDVSADGYAGLVTSACDLVRVTPKPPTKIWRLAGSEYGCETAEAVAIDARHRFWVASREGLSVVGDNRQVSEYPAGSLPELTGRVSQIVVVGQGPALPRVAE